jgi:hypothetical protein
MREELLQPALIEPSEEVAKVRVEEDVPLAVELRDGDPVSELSQAGVAATSGAAVATLVV